MEWSLTRLCRTPAALVVATGLLASTVSDVRAQAEPCSDGSLVGEWRSVVGAASMRLVITSQSSAGELVGT